MQAEAAGELASWLPRLENFVSIPQWQVEGRAAATARGDVSTSRADLPTVSFAVDELYVQGAGLTIREPRIETQGELTWNGQQQTVAAKQATVASSALAVRLQNGSFQWAPDKTSAAGDLDIRADLQRISLWFNTDHAVRRQQITGLAVGKFRAEQTRNGIHLAGAADVQNFAVALPAASSPAVGAATVSQAAAWTTIWNEPLLRLSCDATYTPSNDAAEVAQAAIAGQVLQAAAQGRIAGVTDACRVDLTGQWNYDLALLLDRLRPWIGDDLTMAGRGPRPFTLQGPIFAAAPPHDSPPSSSPAAISDGARVAPDLAGRTSLTWESAQYYGVPCGAGEASIDLRGGVATLGPLDIPLSEGRLTAAPKLLLNETPVVAALDAGPVVQNVRISPEMCRSWLKYVAPLVADATQVEGRFSLDLSQPARISLNDPGQSRVQGAMKIHTAQVGPGPL
jgi:hypothetical protein